MLVWVIKLQRIFLLVAMDYIHCLKVVCCISNVVAGLSEVWSINNTWFGT